MVNYKSCAENYFDIESTLEGGVSEKIMRRRFYPVCVLILISAGLLNFDSNLNPHQHLTNLILSLDIEFTFIFGSVFIHNED